MVPVIHTARDVHGANTAAELVAQHAAHIGRHRQRGRRLTVHRDRSPQVAHINHNRWLFDCTCGAGVATDPAWGVGCCFGCGAVYDHVVTPNEADRLNIEHLLMARRQPSTRHWHPRESLLSLALDNAAHGVRW